MGDHFALDVDRLVKPEISTGSGKRLPLPPPEMLAGPSSASTSSAALNERMEEAIDVEAPLITMAECRICQDEDSISQMESPCACSGSLKYAHRKCVQHWCNEKGDVTCEICHQPYQSGYTAPPPQPRLEETTIDIGGGWQIYGTPLDLHDPRILAIAEAERQFLEAEYDDYNSTNSSGAAFCRSAALILMALLLLRHAVTVTDTDGEDNASSFFTLFLLRATGFLLPCYIMAWVISILQRRRQRQVNVCLAVNYYHAIYVFPLFYQPLPDELVLAGYGSDPVTSYWIGSEAAALAAAQFAFMLQSRQPGGLQFTIASAPTVTTPQQEQLA